MTSDASRLRSIKLLHTIAWAFFGSCVLGIFPAALFGRLSIAAVLIACVAVEVGVLLANHWRCPLTDVAARYTEAREPNFDIYLPRWLARYNKEIFGTLYVAGIALTLVKWFSAGR